MKFEIKCRFTGNILFEMDCESVKMCVEGAPLEFKIVPLYSAVAHRVDEKETDK